MLIAPLSNQFPRAGVQKIAGEGCWLRAWVAARKPSDPESDRIQQMAFDAMCHKEVRSWIVQKITLDWLEYNWLELTSS